MTAFKTISYHRLNSIILIYSFTMWSLEYWIVISITSFAWNWHEFLTHFRCSKKSLFMSHVSKADICLNWNIFTLIEAPTKPNTSLPSIMSFWCDFGAPSFPQISVIYSYRKNDLWTSGCFALILARVLVNQAQNYLIIFVFETIPAIK